MTSCLQIIGFWHKISFDGLNMLLIKAKSNLRYPHEGSRRFFEAELYWIYRNIFPKFELQIESILNHVRKSARMTFYRYQTRIKSRRQTNAKTFPRA